MWNMNNICGLFTFVAGIIITFLWFFKRFQKINLFSHGLLILDSWVLHVSSFHYQVLYYYVTARTTYVKIFKDDQIFIFNQTLPPVMISAKDDQFGHFFGLKFIWAKSQMYFMASKNTNI